MSALIVIPARWGSTRFPGKPLADVRGKTLLHRVVLAARRAADERPGTEVVVATDDARIADHAATLGCEAVVTDAEIDSGTARSFAAAGRRAARPDAVLNLQGDTPFVSPDILLAILDALAGGAAVATPVIRLGWPALDALREQKRTSPFSGTTCVRGDDGQALWFSKQIIPAIRGEEQLRQTQPLSPVLRHIGLYGYSRDALERFVAAAPARYERLEQLEQLRFLEMGIAIEAVLVEPPTHAMSGIDTPADLDRACRLIDELGEPGWL